MQAKNQWTELTVTASAAAADLVAQFLIELGSNGIVEEKAPAGAAVLKAYLPCDGHVEGAIQAVRGYLAAEGMLPAGTDAAAAVRRREIEDEDWNAKWKSFFEPLKVTRRIVIKPSWRNYWQREGELVIELDPGMAFGTGTHPSTRMCLQVIEELAEQLPDPGAAALLDVGTGSGILAFAAAVLGFGRVAGIDSDRQAVACAAANARQNGLEERTSFSATPLEKVVGDFTVVVANILPHVLIGLRDQLTDRMAAGGWLVLSGILTEKAPEVSAAFSPLVTPVRQLHEEAWSCLVFQKSA